MATEYTPEEIQAIFDEYHDAMRRGIPVSTRLAEEMADAVKGIKNYNYQLNLSIKGLAQSSKQLGSDLANGAKGASVFNNSIESAGTVAATVASQFGVLGKAVGLAINALTFFITAVTKQSDALYSSFQQLSRSGVIGAQGMDDVFQSMRRMGYTIDELDKMSAVLMENSRNFAMFSGTAATGGRKLADMVFELEDVRTKFFNLGLGVDDINRATAGYYRQMGRLGRTQEATSAGAQAYIVEMEKLTRLTGLQRKELEDQREMAEDIDQFYASLMEMDPEAAKHAYGVFNQLMAMDPSGKKARAFALSMDGIISGSDDQMQALFSSNFQLLEFAQALKQGRIDQTQFMQAFSDSIRTNIPLQKELAKIGVTDLFGGLKSNVLLANKGLVPFYKQLGLTEKEINDLMAGINAATNSQGEMRNNQILASQSLNEFVNLGINPATKAMEIFAKVVEFVTSLLPGSGRAKKRYEQEQVEKSAARIDRVTGSLFDRIIQAESGGRNIGNVGGTSSAFGVAQITKGTFEDIVKRATPDSKLYGKTFEDMKQSVELQKDALAELTAFNQKQLEQKGVKATDTATYLAHFLGAQGALKVLQADKTTPIEKVVSGRQIYANPKVFETVRTAEDLIKWASRKINDQGQQGTAQAAAPKTQQSTAQAAAPTTQQQSATPQAPTQDGRQNQRQPEISGAFGWKGTVSGPQSGYRPNVLMHGTEELTIKPMTQTVNSNSVGTGGPGDLSDLIKRVDDLIYVSRAQLNVNEKMLKYQH